MNISSTNFLLCLYHSFCSLGLIMPLLRVILSVKWDKNRIQTTPLRTIYFERNSCCLLKWQQLMCFNTSVEMLLYLYVKIKLMVFPKLFSFSLERRLLQHTTSGHIIVAVGCWYNKNIFIWFIFPFFKSVYPHNIYKRILSWLKNLENITIADSA